MASWGSIHPHAFTDGAASLSSSLLPNVPELQTFPLASAGFRAQLPPGYPQSNLLNLGFWLWFILIVQLKQVSEYGGSRITTSLPTAFQFTKSALKQPNLTTTTHTLVAPGANPTIQR